MNPGKLNRRIEILRPPGPDDVDEVGQPLEDYTHVTTIWASIQPLRGRELFAAQQANAETTVKLTIRYRKDIDRTMIAKYGDVEFEFLYVINPDYANKELQIMCKERQ